MSAIVGKDYIVRSPFSSVKIPSNVDVFTYTTRNFHNYPERIALIDGETRENITFGQLQDLIDYAAANLHRAGYDKKKPLAFFMRNCLEYIVLSLASWRLGGFVTCINAMLLEDEVRSELNLTHSEFLVCDETTLKAATKAAKGTNVQRLFCKSNSKSLPADCTFISTLMSKCDVTCLPNKLDVIDPKREACMILFSSGTTGLPKGVRISHIAFMNACSLGGDSEMKVLSKDHGIVYQPMSHLYGIWMAMAHLCWGVTQVVMPSFDLERFLQLTSEFRVDQIQLVPPILVLLASTKLTNKYDVSYVTCITCGAAPISKELEEQVAKVIGPQCQIRQGYGMTESSLTTTHFYCPPNTAKQSSYKCYTGSVGYPLPDTKIKIIDVSTGDVLGPNKEGELCVKSYNLMLGYQNNQKATDGTIDPQGWLHTGDLAYYNEDGCFYIEGRLKELIKYKGYQVAPAELEAVLLSHTLVIDAAVVGIPDPSVGEVPLAWVVCKEGIHLTEQQLHSFVNAKVAYFKQIRGGIRFVQAIPKSPSGKILRREIYKVETKKVSKL